MPIALFLAGAMMAATPLAAQAQAAPASPLKAPRRLKAPASA
jgi:hypothetical protein